MPTLGEAIRETITNKDAARAGRISDRMRRRGLNYNQQLEIVLKAAPGTEFSDWDELLYEADSLESLRS